jgi:hypothetical protein
MLRAWPPAPPNGNGGRARIEGVGQLAGSGPAVGASGPGQPAGNVTLGGLWRGYLTPPPSSPLPRCLHRPPPPSIRLPIRPYSPPPFFPSLTNAHQTLSTSFCWHFSKEFCFFIFRGLWYGSRLNCRVYVGGV